MNHVIYAIGCVFLAILLFLRIFASPNVFTETNVYETILYLFVVMLHDSGLGPVGLQACRTL